MSAHDAARTRRQIPDHRLGHPDEVADLALTVARNPHLTDQVIPINGGMHPR